MTVRRSRPARPGEAPLDASPAAGFALDDASSQPAVGSERWRSFLQSELRCPVEVVYTRARKKPLQVRPVRTRPRTHALEVRMHAFFDSAPPEVHRAVASWIKSGRRAPRACALLDQWILESLEKLPAPAIRDATLRPRGRCHDLERFAADLLGNELASDFASPADLPHLTFGRQGQSRTRHSIRLGSYDQEGSIVRIHPALDQDAVPAWFVRYVLFHELLHAIHPPRKGEGERWIHHGREFRRRERAYPDYPRALAWEAANIKEVIRSARSGKPMRLVLPVPAEPALASAAQAPRAPAKPRPAPERKLSTAGKIQRVLQGWLFPS